MAGVKDAGRPRTRQDLYDQIRATSKAEVILEDMIRLGFWPAEGARQSDPADEIRRRAELHRALGEARAQNSRLASDAATRKELLRRRLAAAKERRLQTRAQNEAERQARAVAWQARKAREILYLGPGVSAGLQQTTLSAAEEERLRGHGLPLLASPTQIADALGLTIAQLRFLCHARTVSRVSHYVRFRRPKKTGGERLISAPRPRLKAAQSWILRNLLQKVVPHEAAHGFRGGRSILSNATPHLQKGVVVNVDLQDFFPTVGYRRVKGLFRALGYSESAATIFALLCTEPAVEEVELDGQRYYVALSEREGRLGPAVEGRRLPQGAPTSPALTNVLCRRLDRRLQGMASALGFTYTRYADDLTFSGSGDAERQVGALLRRMTDIVKHEGFVVHPDKTRVLRRSRRQEVTGVVVNSKPAVPRDVLRRFRATLFQVEKDGPAGKRWGAGADLLTSLVGFASYVFMIDPQKGRTLLTRARALEARHRPQAVKPVVAAPETAATPAVVAAEAPASPSSATPTADKPKKKWWKLW